MDLGGLPPEAVEAALLDCGASSVTLSNAGEQPVLEPAPGETPLWSSTRISALFDDRRKLDDISAALRESLDVTALPPHRIETLEDRDWEREWLKDFAPMRFGERLWVCPAGMPPGDPDGIVLELDPGLAFGTGTHPTTALCLAWLDGLALDGETVLDYGCGSGILAIAALKLGAGRARGFDIDPQAIIASRDNAAANGVSERLEVTIEKPPPSPPADVVVANILAGPLVELATEILDLTITGGKLALSGILSDQITEVSAAYSKGVRFDPPATMEQDGQVWARLSGIRL
ncbi:MAG: 50S ribosomal protein L11 methyltransferase [Pseudomonadota bacterium]